VKRRDAMSMLRGWLALSKSMARHGRCSAEQKGARIECAAVLKRVRAVNGHPPLDDELAAHVEGTLRGIASAFGFPSRWSEVHAAAAHNIREDGHVMFIPPWWGEKSQMKPDEMKKAMALKGWTQTELADVLGVTQPAVQRWLSGSRRIPLHVAIAIRKLA